MKKLITLFFTMLLWCSHAQAIEIAVGKGKVAAKPIAVVPFAGNSKKDAIDYIVSVDLKQSGVFAPISPNSYGERPTGGNNIAYPVFKQLGAAYVVAGSVFPSDHIQAVLADVFQGKVIAEFNVSLKNKTLRQGAHELSDRILEKLTGTRGAFASRLVYVQETGNNKSRRYQLMLSDTDGANPVQLLSSSAPIMTPRFSPNGRFVSYVTFEGKHAQIVTHDVYSGKRQLVVREPGINASPAWSPDGTKIAMVLSRDGNSEIYYKQLGSGKLVRVTNHPAIDTEPVWSSDGRSLYFTSDRDGGVPQLYRIDVASGKMTRITTGRYSAGAAVSPDGRRIALSRNQGAGFVIGTIDLQSGQFFGVSNGTVDETPRFSPNGKMLIFTSEKGGKSVLKIANVDGTASNTLSGNGFIRDADWSTYLK